MFFVKFWKYGFLKTFIELLGVTLTTLATGQTGDVTRQLTEKEGGFTGDLQTETGRTGGLQESTTGGLHKGITDGLRIGTTGGLQIGKTGGLQTGTMGGLQIGKTGGLQAGTTGGLQTVTVVGLQIGTTGGLQKVTVVGLQIGTTGGLQTDEKERLTGIDAGTWETFDIAIAEGSRGGKNFLSNSMLLVRWCNCIFCLFLSFEILELIAEIID